MARRLPALFALALLLGSCPSAGAATFEGDVLPILANHCLGCHGGLRQRGELDLRTVAALLRGGKSGPAVRAGELEKSLLWQKVSRDEMPKAPVKLSAAEKKVLRGWIAAGLPRAPGLDGVKVKRGARPRDPLQVAVEIDRDLEGRLKKAGRAPAPLADDAEFQRRVYLDLVGRPPTPAQARAFLASTKGDKRVRLVDELLARPEYGRHWATTWHHLLVPLDDGKRVYDLALLDWLAGSFDKGRGWDGVVADLLTAAGPAAEKPQVGFLAAHKEPDKIGVKVADLFLGVALECAECHDHPTKRWRQKEDFWGLAAFFRPLRVARSKGGVTLTEGDVRLKGKKAPAAGPAIQIPDTAFRAAGQVVPARFPGEEAPAALKAPYRQALADWLTGPKNPYFAVAAANRAWAHCFGRGLAHPLNDLHEGNPPSHPEVLATLAHEFAASGHDWRHLLRCVCLTRAYQRTSQADGEDEELQKHFGRMPLRLLPPDVLYDAFTQALGVKDLSLKAPAPPKKKGPPTPARELFVNTFVQTAEGDPTAFDHGPLQVLQRMNLRDFNDGGEVVAGLVADKADAARALEELYLRTLSRRPTAAEAEKLTRYLRRAGDAKKGYSSVLWLLLNTSEFVFNH